MTFKELDDAMWTARNALVAKIGNLGPRQAHMVIDALRIERELTDRFLHALLDDVRELQADLKDAERMHEQSTKTLHGIIRQAWRIAARHGIELEPLPDHMKEH